MFNFSKEFVISIISKDKTAFNDFYIKTVDVFFRYLKSNYYLDDHQVNDILSNFYLKVWNGVDKYDFDYSFEWWIWTIFKNSTKDYFKYLKTWSSIIYPNDTKYDISQEAVSDENIKLNLENDYQFDHIKKAMDNLDDISKEVIHLKYVEQLSNNEISKILWISTDNVRQKLSRWIKALKARLDID